MAIRPVFASANYLSRVTNIPAMSPLTICCWLKLASSQTNRQNPFAIYGTSTEYIYYGTDAVGTRMTYNLEGNGTDVLNIVDMGTGNWYFFALTVNGTSIHNYYAAVADVALTDVAGSASSSSWFTPGTLVLCQRPDTFGRLDGTVSNVKIWTATLTPEELNAERWLNRPSRTDNLHAWYPTLSGGAAERVLDYSGNGFTWTENGTINDEDGPPVSWGASPLLLPFALTAAIVDQEGYRFRNDDGSESAATWRQAQDTPDALAALTPFRLRMLLNATGDPASAAYRIEYRKTDSLDWRKVN